MFSGPAEHASAPPLEVFVDAPDVLRVAPSATVNGSFDVTGLRPGDAVVKVRASIAPSLARLID